MTVPTDKLLRMAEQITTNMAYTDDTEVVAEKIADHLYRFWDPRMLAALKACNNEQAESLSPALAAAVLRLERPPYR